MIKEESTLKRGRSGRGSGGRKRQTSKGILHALRAINSSPGKKPTLATLNTANLILTQLILIHNALDVILTATGSLINTPSILPDDTDTKS